MQTELDDMGKDPPVISSLDTRLEGMPTETVRPGAPTTPPKADDTTGYQEVSLVGKTIADVHVEKSIKSGGMAAVYLGTNTKTGKKEVLKALHAKWVNNEVAKKRFMDDAKATSKLKHPSIIPTLRDGIHEGENPIPYIVYPYIEDAKDLWDCIKPDSQVVLSLEDRAKILAQVADALTYSHRNGVIHRDVKSENIIVEPSTKRGILIDFGIAKIIEEEMNITMQGELLGTPTHVSPEQGTDPSDVNVKGAADLYSWACTYYEAVTGLQPLEQRITNPTKKLVNRVNLDMPFELWVNDAIELRRDQIAQMIREEKDPVRRKYMEAQLAELIPVSDELEELIMTVLHAKDKKERPSFGYIIDKHDKLVEQDKIRRRKPTEKEIEEDKASKRRLEQKIASCRQTLCTPLEDVDQMIVISLALTEALGAFAEATPIKDGARLIRLKEAVQQYGEVEIELRKARKIPDEIFAEEKVGVNALYNNALKRQQLSETQHFGTETREIIATLKTLLGKNDYDGVAQHYGRIHPTKVPPGLQPDLDEVRKQIEGVVDASIGNCAQALGDNDLDKANEHYTLAEKLAKVLPDASKALKQDVGKLYQQIQEAEVSQLTQMHQDARRINDYVKMHECAEGIQKRGQNADELMKALAKQKDDIVIVRGLIQSTDELKKEFDKETAASQTGLPRERIDYYKSSIQEKLDKLDPGSKFVKEVNIGPRYGVLKTDLTRLQEDVGVQESVLGVGEGPFAQRAESLSRLILHYHTRNDLPKERLFISVYRKLLEERAAEIDKAKRPN